MKSFIEIKGDNEKTIQDVAGKLGFNYDDAVRGSVNEAYRGEYAIPKGMHICDESVISFAALLPAWLKKLSRKD